MTRAVASARYLRGLNDEQRAAVLHTHGPLLVLAGAGSGKTKTLVHRIVHLIRGERVDPRRLVVVTFTNKAADEMRERAEAFAGAEARQAVISTFHSLGVRILREHAERLDLPRRFAIYATADQLGALRTALQEISIDDDRFDLKRVLWRISDWKTRRVSPDAARREVAEGEARGDRRDEYAVLAADAYPRYEEVLRACGAVDFDDLLLLPVRLLETDDDVRQDVWRRWHYLMIDEYQDTNGVQLELARLLAGPRRNLCVVGDDDQSIYAFRGADVGNILEFERHFPGARVVVLEQNYRSTKRILEAANAIIAENRNRHPKRLRTENGIGEPLDVYEHEDEIAEAETVAKEIGFRRFRHKREWRDFAVLYRANTQARPLEEAFREQNLPYRVIGGTSFFERKEVADALAYLRIVANPRDEIALRRIINFPTRGIGRTTVLRVAEIARERGMPFAVALAEAGADVVGTAQARSIDAFLSLLEEARAGLSEAERAAADPPPVGEHPPLAQWAGRMLRDVGLHDAIRGDRRTAHTAEARVDNLHDLVGSIARMERRIWAERAEIQESVDEDARAAALEDAGWTPPTLSVVLGRLALSPPDEDDDDPLDGRDVVTLMTLHSAKGLEFDDVFIVGLEEEILPHARALAASDEDPTLDALAEERRLLYVGVTRARRRLTLSRCLTRSRRGESVPRQPSRYLDAIPDSLVNLKSAESILSPEESAELRRNFFDEMRALLTEDD